MEISTLIIGVLAFAYAIFSGIMRVKKPEMFKKLEPMKEKLGEKAGNTIHFVSYVVAPFLFGCYAIYAGLNGVSFF